VRHVRRDGMDALKKSEKDHQISQDDHKRMDTEVQRATDQAITDIDHMLATKEKEIMTVLSVAPCPRAVSQSPASKRRVMSPSSWMATADGRRRAACRA